MVVPEALRQALDDAAWTTLLADNFTSNRNNWLVGENSDEVYFSRLNQRIEKGRYRWDAQVRRPSSLSTTWLTGYPVTDFHAIVSCQHLRGSSAGSSCGIVFRVQDNYNLYWFRITDSQQFAVSVVQGGHWQPLVNWTRSNAIKPNRINQLQVMADDSRFSFFINEQVVSKIEDNLFPKGLVGLAIEGYTAGEETVFDFLDLTLRARTAPE